MERSDNIACCVGWERAPARSFRWRDKDGIMHPVEEMSTRHLFYTVRMIWNHSVPEEFRLRPYRPYKFSTFYTPRYMSDGVGAMLDELSRRENIPAEFLSALKYMCSTAAQLFQVKLDAPPL